MAENVLGILMWRKICKQKFITDAICLRTYFSLKKYVALKQASKIIMLGMLLKIESALNKLLRKNTDINFLTRHVLTQKINMWAKLYFMYKEKWSTSTSYDIYRIDNKKSKAALANRNIPHEKTADKKNRT